MEQSFMNYNNNNYEDLNKPIGTAKTLERAMKVNKLSEMIDCIKNMRLYANTIEKDLLNYSNIIHTNTTELKIDDFLQLAKQRFNNKNNKYILLSDLIDTKHNSYEHQESSQLPSKTHGKSLLEKQITYMKDVIAAQPSALEGVYLEALLNPDQWQSNHQFLRTNPMDILTLNERKRLNKILNRT